MAAPKVFVSSTCYDLNVLRGELRGFISSIGYEPFMSEFSDLLFDPRQHTHSSCVQEVGSCDMLVLIVGKRFGGSAIPDAITTVDFSALEASSKNKEFLSLKEKLSVTQLEVLKAIELGVPVFSFVDAGVMNDHFTYERNKAKPILTEIEFPNIEKQDTAKYIFEFINFLRLRSSGNAMISFTRLEEIREHLRRQWAALFQRMLYMDRTRQQEVRRFEILSSQIAGLQAAVLGSISSSELKETAKGAIQYRRLVEFLMTLNRNGADLVSIIQRDISWEQLLTEFDVVKVQAVSSPRSSLQTAAIILKDGTYFQSRMPDKFIQTFISKWNEFKSLKKETKEAVVNAVLEGRDSFMSPLRYIDEQFSEIESKQVDLTDVLEHRQNVLRNNSANEE